jgi:hypothetical protein
MPRVAAPLLDAVNPQVGMNLGVGKPAVRFARQTRARFAQQVAVLLGLALAPTCRVSAMASRMSALATSLNRTRTISRAVPRERCSHPETP